MNKRQARWLAIGSTVIATVAFLGLTLDSHRQFAKLTNADKITPAVTRGKDAWHKNNCINCRTVFGEGAYYAPDLTKITKLLGEAYLAAYMRDPSKFYDETRHRRLMPKQDLSDSDISDLITFLGWVSKFDNNGWPPRPILVSGATLPGTDLPAAVPGKGVAVTPPGARPVSESENPIALGERVFRSAVPVCAAGHSIAPGVDMAGPSSAGLAARTEKLLTSSGSVALSEAAPAVR